MKTILYVYGMGGSPNGETKKALEQITRYNVLSVEFDQNNFAEGMKTLKEFVKHKKIDCVVGSSLGAYFALTLEGVCRVVINPCYDPSTELKMLGVADDVIATYPTHFSNIDRTEDRNLITALFADEDELFGDKYVKQFAHDFEGKIHRFHGHHHFELEKNIPNIKEIIDAACDRAANYSHYFSAKDNISLYEK